MKSSNTTLEYYLVTDRHLYHEPLHSVARKADESGVAYFQLREKDLGPRELLVLARHLRPMLIHTQFIINGLLDVALRSEADGIHLQRGNLQVAEVRRRYPGMIIGYSAHSRDDIVKAEEQGASYVLLSPIFRPRSKPSDLPPIGLDGFRSCVEGIRIPVFALGGIEKHHLKQLQSCGCAGVAAISLFVEHGKFSNKGMIV